MWVSFAARMKFRLFIRSIRCFGLGVWIESVPPGTSTRRHSRNMPRSVSSSRCSVRSAASALSNERVLERELGDVADARTRSSGMQPAGLGDAQLRGVDADRLAARAGEEVGHRARRAAEIEHTLAGMGIDQLEHVPEPHLRPARLARRRPRPSPARTPRRSPRRRGCGSAASRAEHTSRAVRARARPLTFGAPARAHTSRSAATVIGFRATGPKTRTR